MEGTLNQKKAIKLLRKNGWRQVRGGKHQVKMVKQGRRPITLMKRDSTMKLTANVHIEDGALWADVTELPGCFASGETLDELFDSLREGIALYLTKDDPQHSALASEARGLMDDPSYVSESLETAALMESLRPDLPRD